MLNVLQAAESYGLRSSDYAGGLGTPALPDAAAAERFDRSLTAASVRFISQLRSGRISPRAAGFNLPALKAATDADQIASRLATAQDVRQVVEEYEPRPQPYRLLKQALETYRQLAKESLPPLPAPKGRSLKRGDEYAAVPALRRYLMAVGDLPRESAPSDETIFDATLSQAIQTFQGRHGLKPDGVLGPQTLAALNVPLSERVRQIELSMERWRWLAALDRPDIVVNIPHFMLYALPRPQRSEEPIEMPVIVGRSHTRTPIFVAGIQEVIFQPYWDVPASITRNELLPKLRQDISYLEKHHFEIVRGPGDDATVVEPTAAALDALQAGRLRLRQRPGPDNALGPVKFVLPNPYEIRLHGTAEPHLFDESLRAFSHGCIRVSEPAVLAEYVLANAPGQWDSAAVEQALCETQMRRVKLDRPVRVVVFYATAAATRSKGVLFARDIYGHDARLEKLLRANVN